MTAITCDVCPRSCRLEEGETGFCNVRKNVAGENVDGLFGLVSDHSGVGRCLQSGKVKNSVWLPGCNLGCWFCVNRELSQLHNPAEVSLMRLPPRDFAEVTWALNIQIAWFYSGEPSIHHEYVAEACQIARQRHPHRTMNGHSL